MPFPTATVADFEYITAFHPIIYWVIFLRKIIMFFVGGMGYGLIEILWRGYTHPSMLAAGGICFSFFGYLSEKLQNKSILLKAVLGSGFVTFIELSFGIVFNIILKQNVWNYSNRFLNFKGQICPLYSVFWLVLSLVFIPLAQKVNRALQNR